MKRVVGAILIIAMLTPIFGCSSKGTQWQEQYDLGVRYLSEGNYEEAIIAFTAAIEIDENRAEAHFGRGQSYYGIVDIVTNGGTVEFLGNIETEDDKLCYCYELAIQDYERAIELDPCIAEYYDEIMKVALEYGDIDLMIYYGKLKYQNTEDEGLTELFEAAQTSVILMDKLAEAFEKDSDAEIFSLMQGNTYQSLLFLQDYLGRPILRKYGSKTLGIYQVDTAQYGHCMVYFGDCVNGVRSGIGSWYGYFEGNNYASRGSWSEDMPNGSFETKEWYYGLDELVVYRLVSGNAVNGLWNGNILWAFDTDTGYQSWNCTFVNGLGTIVGEWEDESGTIHYWWSENSNEGDGSLGPREGSENNLQGIIGFIPKQ